MHARLAELMHLAEGTREELIALVRDVPEQQYAHPPSDGGWSVAQVLAHLHLVEHSSVRALFRTLKDGKKAGLERESDTTSLVGSLDASGLREETTKRQAPSFTQPSDSPVLHEALAQLAESREALRTWAREADGFALGTLRFPHPLLGALTLYEWILMLHHHEQRHLRQIRHLLLSPGA
ncbi:MAG: DinB family protein [Gemmatimonadaceae bacterium]